MPDREHAIPCRDAVSRRKTLQVHRLPGDRCALVMPPGESARLDPAGLLMLRQALSALGGARNLRSDV